MEIDEEKENDFDLILPWMAFIYESSDLVRSIEDGKLWFTPAEIKDGVIVTEPSLRKKNPNICNLWRDDMMLPIPNDEENQKQFRQDIIARMKLLPDEPSPQYWKYAIDHGHLYVNTSEMMHMELAFVLKVIQEEGLGEVAAERVRQTMEGLKIPKVGWVNDPHGGRRSALPDGVALPAGVTWSPFSVVMWARLGSLEGVKETLRHPRKIAGETPEAIMEAAVASEVREVINFVRERFSLNVPMCADVCAGVGAGMGEASDRSNCLQRR